MMHKKNIKNLVVIKNGTTQKLCQRVRIADNFFTRFKGLMFKKTLNENEGLLLTRTKYIHTLWMLVSIDVIYLKYINNSDYFVVDYERRKSPWRLGKINRETTDVLELRQGSIDKNNIKVGIILRFLV